MGDITLLQCQATAARQISERFATLVADEDRPMETARLPVPFYQALAAITGAGKTPVLAEAVAEVTMSLPVKPLVLWIAKSRIVVDQTFANFSSGGKYSHFVADFEITTLSRLSADQVRDADTPCIALATVGTFNQKDKADGSLKVHKTAKDTTAESLWDTLRVREAASGERRPLLIVYDEGHNLSDQQAELLLELEPDAILVASATMRTPGRLGRIIDRYKESKWKDADLVTVIPTAPVVKKGLVKQQIVLGGYDTSMESVLDEMLAGLRRAERAAVKVSAGFIPKAIYVSRTNISQEDGSYDNPSKPFNERHAPPILIWRYLVEKKKIDPESIAIYADLKLDRKAFPPPDDFHLFSGGEDDYAAFSKGNYQHIIFNQGLQEGWDDPACCFAYIDKSMGSSLQIEQVIGRVIRQPGARKYSEPDLNTATFFIRLDPKQSFHTVLDDVRRRLGREVPEIKIDGYVATRGKTSRKPLEPKEQRCAAQVHVDSENAVDPVDQVVDDIIDYRSDHVGNTVGPGTKQAAKIKVGEGSDGKYRVKVVSLQHSNRVLARWLVRRRMQALYPTAAFAVDWARLKFDARVEMTSPAAKSLDEAAEKLVDAYIENCELVYEDSNPYLVGTVYVGDEKLQQFDNSLHEGYSDLNSFELGFARGLDDLGIPWARNPVNGGYSIPLLEKGENDAFHPDFLAWNKGTVFLLDPKGGHLLMKDAGLKLLDLRDDEGKRRVQVRLISEGKWTAPDKKTSDGGFTVWAMKNGKPKPTHCKDIKEAAAKSVEPA